MLLRGYSLPCVLGEAEAPFRPGWDPLGDSPEPLGLAAVVSSSLLPSTRTRRGSGKGWLTTPLILAVLDSQ